MELCASCIRCLVDRQEERVRQLGTEKDRNEYMRCVARIIAAGGREDSAPVLVERINEEYQRIFGSLTDYTEVKREFNTLMLSLEPRLREQIGGAEDSLHAAMLYARAANYIDFGMASRIERETLFSLLEQAAGDSLDEKVYAGFLRDLERARSLVYVTDNCGEIVCDKLAVEELAKRFPGLDITVMVRGRDTLNDATREDAAQTGMDRTARIADNGCGVAGTPPGLVSRSAARLLEQADVILAKGQGNFETMHGCGLNIYYSFLCKCDWFQKRFGMEKNRGMFVREQTDVNRNGVGR